MKTEVKINEELLTEYFSIKDIINNRADEIARLIRDNDLRITVSFVGTIELLDISEMEVIAKFSESWSYGGYDSYDISYPTSYLKMNDTEILFDLEKTNTPIRQRRILAEKECKAREIEKDKAELKRLKIKLNQLNQPKP